MEEVTLTLLLFLLAAAAAAAERDLEKRFFGRECTSKQRLYHVALVDATDDPFCGGSLINRRWVLTAGHCANGGSLTVALGGHHWFGKKNRQKHVIPVNRQFKGAGDIMLLRLETDAPVTFPAIRLPPQGCATPEEKSDVKVGGYGPYKLDPKTNRYVSGGETPLLLQCGTMKVTTATGQTFSYAAGNLVDTCPGDSGGGVEYVHDAKQGVRIYGVHVAGRKPSGLCSGPATATDVCHFRDWIHAMLTDKTYDPKGPVGDPDWASP